MVCLFFEEIIYERELADNKDEAIDRLCNRLYGSGRISDLSAFKNAVTAREAEFSTELAPNVYVPHARSKAVIKPSVAYMKTKDGNSVYLIASNTADGHIEALSELSKTLLGN